MREQTRFQDLLGRLLDDVSSPAERDELADLCRGSEARTKQLRDALELDQLIAQNVASNRCEEAFAEDMGLAICAEEAVEDSGAGLADFDELVSKFLDSSLRSHEARRLHWMCLRDQEKARRLCDSLEFADLLSQALNEPRNEESFVDSLVTRMWAEATSDHFVDDVASKIVAIGAFQGEDLDRAAVAGRDGGGLAALPSFGGETRKNRRRSAVQGAHGWGRTIGFAAAAAVATALIVLVLVNGGGGSGDLVHNDGAVDDPLKAVAFITESSDDVRWTTASRKAIGKAGEVEIGRYELASGVVRVRFASGAEMTVEGPAEFEVRSDHEAYVHSGLAMARAENPGDLQVESKGFELVDVDRTFAVDARFEDFTEAVFFDGVGEVRMASGDDTPGRSTSSGHGARSLYAFETVRADHQRDRLVDVPYNPSVFSRTWQLISGVESNSGSVEVQLPGSVVIPRDDERDMVQVFLEKDGFKAEEGLMVDMLTPGKFTSLAEADGGGSREGVAIRPQGELRSYLLQRWAPQRTGSTLEASVTFSEPVVGVIFSSDKLKQSDKMVGADLAALEDMLYETGKQPRRGLDQSGDDQILLSADGRTLNVVLHSGNEDALDHIRVLVERQ